VWLRLRSLRIYSGESLAKLLCQLSRELRLTQLCLQLTVGENSAVLRQQQQSEELAELPKLRWPSCSDSFRFSKSSSRQAQRRRIPKKRRCCRGCGFLPMRWIIRANDDGELCEQVRRAREAELDQMIQEAESALKDLDDLLEAEELELANILAPLRVRQQEILAALRESETTAEPAATSDASE
uniref:FH2 domain-containing protein n=1 Tax=Macrostomum lignano TaxID=282301 RepID=A0A1I8JQ27_9PLAT